MLQSAVSAQGLHYCNTSSSFRQTNINSFSNEFVLSLTLLLLNTSCPVLANSLDPDQLASEEAN